MLTASPDIALCDDIVEELNGRSWSHDLVAQRCWIPEWSQARDLDRIQVAVYPALQPTGELNSRNDLLETWPVDICVAQALQQKSREEVDSLIRLVDELRRFLQLQVFEIGATSPSRFVGLGFEFLTRWDPQELTRESATLTELELYTGTFLSAFRIPYLLLEGD